MSNTSVLYVNRRDAKALKSRLEAQCELDRRYRMVPTTPDAICTYTHDEGTKANILSGQCIAVPVSQSCISKLHEYSWSEYIVGAGTQYCPFSTSMGNRRSKSINDASNKTYRDISLNDAQHALVEAMTAYCLETKSNEIHPEEENRDVHRQHMLRSVQALSAQTCPKKLEVIGDDRTLVVPRWSLYLIDDDEVIPDKEKGVNEFRKLLIQYCPKIASEQHTKVNIQSLLWENLASTHRCSRVVRRGDIDPESSVRESGHRILWPQPANASGDFNRGFILSTTGKDSPGWITVTEHKISQSFDITRVMFSRGNVTEKKRFASLVQEGERILDMYAGIGYYSLPALVHGKAEHVTACEWNPNALYALKYNLKANGVENRASVLDGDCRVSLKTLVDSNDDTNAYKQFDRISLGLLPSSEGGWAVAIACLDKTTGGWLHIHGNVPTSERHHWSHWVCQTLKQFTNKYEHSEDWHAVCVHVEKVKSFAPLVDHLVADVFVGPINSPKVSVRTFRCTGVVNGLSGEFDATEVGKISPPSCALGKDGVLRQDWLS